MAKAKSSPKAVEKNIKNAKPKGIVPNYTKKPPVVVEKPELPKVGLCYFGVSTAMIARTYKKPDMAGVSYVDNQLCWQSAQYLVRQYNSKHHKQLSKICDTVKTTSGSWQLNAVEIDLFDDIITKGIMSKRLKFWHYVSLILQDKVAPNLGFHFEDPVFSDNIGQRAKDFEQMVNKHSQEAALNCKEGQSSNLEDYAEIDSAGQLIKSSKERGVISQQYKYWVIDYTPAPLTPPTEPEIKTKVKNSLPAHTNGIVFKKPNDSIVQGGVPVNETMALASSTSLRN